jgi:hypothetical protein
LGRKGKESNLLMNTQKEINKYVKEKDASNADLMLKILFLAYKVLIISV